VAAEPRYIETLPGRGYRFVAPISRATGSILEMVPAPTATAAEPQRSRRRFVAWAVAGVALVALLVALIAGRRSTVAVKPARFLVSAPRGYYLEACGPRQSFALSPDGEMIAFTAKEASGAFRVFLRDFSEPEARPVPGSEGGYSVI